MTTKQILYSLGILAVLALIFAGLSSLTHAPATAPTAGDKSAILGATLGSDGAYHYSEDKDYYKITADLPGSTGLSAAADAKARATIEQGVAAEIAQFKQDSGFETITAEDAQMQNISGDHKYTLDLEYQAASSSGTVSYAYQVYADTLGAHPNVYYKTFVFDQDGNQLGLKDVLKNNPNWLEELSLLVSQDVTAQLKERLGASAPQGGEGADVGGALYPEGLAAKEENFSNFVVDQDTLVILIPPYQVAAYAVGSFEVHIPLSEINK
jgi:hypothetical protein